MQQHEGERASGLHLIMSEADWIFKPQLPGFYRALGLAAVAEGLDLQLDTLDLALQEAINRGKRLFQQSMLLSSLSSAAEAPSLPRNLEQAQKRISSLMKSVDAAPAHSTARSFWQNEANLGPGHRGNQFRAIQIKDLSAERLRQPVR
jgi:hypothetical protein